MKAHSIALILILLAGVCSDVLAQKCKEKLPIGPLRSGGAPAPKITYKPAPAYTKEARRKNINGTVILQVTFHSSGKVQDVCWVKGLPYGLTKNAIKAAYKIVFEPITSEGKPVSVRGLIEYDFSLY